MLPHEHRNILFVSELHDFFDQINKIDKNIQFTIQHSTKNGEVCEFCNSSGEMVPISTR